MDLKTFVSESLIQIAAGIKEAQARENEYNASFAPTHRRGARHEILEDSYEEVKFDVAVTVEQSDKAGGQFQLTIPLVKMGIEGGDTTTSSQVSRLSFSVKVLWPVKPDFTDPYQTTQNR